MKVSTVKAKCRPWGHRFETPILSDFSYGQFIYSSQDGQSYRYLEALNNKTWDFVSEIVRIDKAVNKKIRDEGKVIQTILGRIADKDSTTEFYQNNKTICPTCGRRAWHIDIDNIVGFIDVEEMTFERFERQAIDEKEREIKLLIG